MTLKQITAKDFKDAVSSLTNGYTCWHKLLGRTDAGTELVFVIGWSDAGYDEEDAKKNGYADGRYTICSKIACQSRYNGSQTDYDSDFEMPYDKETGDVWDTDTMVSNNESDWETDAATYNKDAQDIWDTYCVPNEDGFTALDALFESKKSSNAKKHTCSMQKKKESLAKKNEGKSIDEILEILRSDKYKEDAKRLRDAYQEFETLARRLGYRLVIPNFDGYAPTVLPEDVIDDVMDLLPMSYKQSGDLVDNSQIVGNVCPFIFD